MHFVAVYCIIILQCTLQKNVKFSGVTGRWLHSPVTVVRIPQGVVTFCLTEMLLLCVMYVECVNVDSNVLLVETKEQEVIPSRTHEACLLMAWIVPVHKSI